MWKENLLLYKLREGLRVLLGLRLRHHGLAARVRCGRGRCGRVKSAGRGEEGGGKMSEGLGREVREVLIGVRPHLHRILPRQVGYGMG